jgi:uncharacterized protein YceK
MIIAILAILSSNGCKTSISHGFGANRIYSGTRMTVEMYFDEKVREDCIVGLTIINIIDFPLCLIADTVILPVTLPCSVLGDTGEFKNVFRQEPKFSCGAQDNSESRSRSRGQPKSGVH